MPSLTLPNSAEQPRWLAEALAQPDARRCACGGPMLPARLSLFPQREHCDSCQLAKLREAAGR
jgi:hypothetical protein